MTLVVGKFYKDKLYMCSDRISAESDSGEFFLLNEDKIIQLGNWYIGYCGSYLLRDIIKYRLTNYKMFNKKCTKKTLIKKIVPEIQKCLQEEKALSNSKIPGELLVGSSAGLFVIQCDFSVLEINRYAIGAGNKHATSLLASTNFSCEKVIKKVSKINVFVSCPAKQRLIFEKNPK